MTRDIRQRVLPRLVLALAWLVLYPLGCFTAVISFTVCVGMSGDYHYTDVHPELLCVSMICIWLTAEATRFYFKTRTFGGRDRRRIASG